MSDNISDIIRQLSKASDDGTLVIFVGAGISKYYADTSFSNCQMPSWDDLIRILKKEGNIKGEIDYLKIAQMYYNYAVKTIGEGGYIERLKDLIPINIKPSKTHVRIFETYPHIIVTTNWDTLLEDEADTGGYIYDTIACDDDLVQSSIDRKIIKMHGDFLHNSIVFKEDDYLSYSDNFPLIENYIKSLLLTHTILFIGYSYNDINIKQIMYWIRSRSKVVFPAYIALIDIDPNIKSYMQNNNLIPIKIDKDSNEGGLTLDELLDCIKPSNITKVELQNNDALLYIANRLRPLNSFAALMFNHIENRLTNCAITSNIANDGNIYSILSFDSVNGLASLYYNKKVRSAYEKLLEKMRSGDVNNNEMSVVYEVLSKAGVDGIFVSPDFLLQDSFQYFSIQKNCVLETFFNDIIQFNFKKLLCNKLSFDNRTDDRDKEFVLPSAMISSYAHFQLEEYKDAFDCINIAITELTKVKRFVLLIAAWYNYNIILWTQKYLGVAINESFVGLKEIDIEDRFNHLPATVRRDIKPMFDIVMGNKISTIYYELSELRNKKEIVAKNVKAGGFAIDCNRFVPFAKYKNLVRFVINNCLFMDIDKSYQDTAKMAIGIYLTQHSIDKTVEIDIFQTYVCIKLFENNELSEMFSRFTDNSANESVGQLIMSNENIKVFIEVVFFNITDIYLQCAPTSKYETYIANLYFLMGIITLTKDFVDKIAQRTLQVIKGRSCTFVFLKAVNKFFAYQFNLHNAVVDKALDIIEVLIEKFVQEKASFSEITSLQYGTINNLFTCAYFADKKFNNVELTKQLVNYLGNEQIKKRFFFTFLFCTVLYDICDDECKDIMNVFLLSVYNEMNNDKEAEHYIIINRWTYKLWLGVRDIIKIDETFITSLIDFLEKEVAQQGFCSDLFGLTNLIKGFIKSSSKIISNEQSVKLKDLTDKLFYKEKLCRMPSSF